MKNRPAHRPRDPESVQSRVEKIIEQRGQSTADDVLAIAKDLTRDQVVTALLSLRRTGRLTIVKRGRSQGKGKGSTPSVYDTPSVSHAAFLRRAVSSVFDLGGKK